MKKTSLYLEPDVDAALARLARQRGITKAELIRQSLRDTAATERRPQVVAIGVGHGPGGVSADTDAHLSDSGFGK
jgi:predicted transcriptional regulator